MLRQPSKVERPSCVENSIRVGIEKFPNYTCFKCHGNARAANAHRYPALLVSLPKGNLISASVQLLREVL